MLENFFALKEHGTSVRTEVLAGIVTFMMMSYILIVQPLFMGAAGMDVGAVCALTALLSGGCSIVMGLYTNRPFAMAPAMGSNAFFAFTMVQGGLATWQEGLGMTLISGVAFLLLTAFGLREQISRLIPRHLKLSIGASVGFFITYISFKNSGIMAIDKGGIHIGDMSSAPVLLTLFGLGLVSALMAYRVRGAILISIVATTIVGIPLGITKVPHEVFSLPPSIMPIAFHLDVLGALKLSFFPLIFTFFVGDFFSTLGTVLGVSAKAGLLDKEGNLEGINKPFLVDSLATIAGALLGSTVVTTYVESASGVEAGGRTGLVAIITGGCFLLALFFIPLISIIPAQAVAPALIIIGLLMATIIKDIDFSCFEQSLSAFLTIAFTIFTASLANGISMGIIAYVFIKLIKREWRYLNPLIYPLCALLILYFSM